jgi:Xaa-Pro aminopeptidase
MPPIPSPRRTRVALLAILSLATVAGTHAEPAFTSVFPPAEFAAHRAVLMERIGDGVAVLQGAPEPPAELPFRQSNDFFYLTGVEIPRALLLIDGRSKRSTLFLPAATERRDRMFGEELAPGDQAERITGIESVVDRNDFGGVLAAAVGAGRALYIPFRPAANGGGSSSDAVAFAKASGADPWDGGTSLAARFVDRLKAAAPQASIRDLDPVVDRLRLFKTPREIARIRKATAITCEAILEAMRETRPGIQEYELQAAAEYVFKRHGAQGPAYFPLIATGPDTIYSHYHRGTRVLQDGDLVQFDYAPDYGYYVSDVTRVFPAGGTFTPWQREWYGIYLTLYNDVMTSIRPHVPVRDIVHAAVERMQADVVAYRFSDSDIQKAAFAFVDRYRESPGRSLGHWVGMEVHDVGGVTDTLEPGQVFTIEPAMPIPSAHLGLRLEDVILVTGTGYENLSGDLPTDVASIERIMHEPGIEALRRERDRSLASTP